MENKKAPGGAKSVAEKISIIKDMLKDLISEVERLESQLEELPGENDRFLKSFLES